jgi:polyhydroxybutyrate depolymerase
MTLRIVCTGDRTFAAIALLVASMPEPTGSDCRPPSPLPVLMINGTADDVMPYGGGFGVLPNSKVRGVYGVWPAERLAAFFRQHNGCAEGAEKSILPGQSPHKIEVERSTKCTGGPVHFYRVVGGGHDLRLQFSGASRLILHFFSGATPAAARSEKSR